ncbi:MAG: NfeD family protein [Candidatus Delongbacteria bacterium]
MNWSGPTAWWIVTALLVAAELTTGTFFLLMLALGVAAGALAAHAGLGLSAQMITAALVGGGAVTGWYIWRRQQPVEPPSQENRNMILDIGARIQVDRWEADGTARVQYRGASWAARWQGQGAPEPGVHVVRKVDGSCLLLDR